MTADARRRLFGGAVVVTVVALGLWLWPRDPVPVTSGGVDAGVWPPQTFPTRVLPPLARSVPVVPQPVTLVRAKGPMSFEGEVRSQGSGQPIPNAEVNFEFNLAAWSTRTDAQGAFRFLVPVDGTWTLALVTARGFHSYAPEWGHSPITFTARPGVQFKGLVFTLAPALEYRGQVVNARGAAVEGAEVKLLGGGSAESTIASGPTRWTTDAQGRFTFIARDGDWLEAVHPVHGRGRAEVDGDAQRSRELTLELDPEPPATSGRVVGRVRYSNLRSAEDALVFIASAHSWTQDPVGPFDGGQARPDVQGPIEQAVVADEDGHFSFEGLAEGRYVVVAKKQGWVSASAWAEPGDVVELTLREGGSIEGEVKDGAGQPVPAFSLVVREVTGALSRDDYQTQAFISPEGRFKLTGVPDGTFALVAGAAGYAPSSEVQARVENKSTARVELRLSQGGTAIGKVSRREDQTPLPGVRVAVEGNWGEGASALPLVAESRTGADGRFVLAGLAPGLRSIVFTADGRHGRIQSGLEIKEGQTVGPLEFDLAAVDGGESPQLELVGIGVVLVTQRDSLVVQQVVEGGGAAEKGLARGDRILEIDGARTAQLGFERSIEAIRGHEGTTVRLEVGRVGGEVVTLDVPRRKIVK